MHFKHSEALSFGIELELQLVSPGTGRLSPSADKVQAHLATGPHATRFALEATLATLEVNSSIHSRGDAMMEEMRLLVEQARRAAQANGSIKVLSEKSDTALFQVDTCKFGASSRVTTPLAVAAHTFPSEATEMAKTFTSGSPSAVPYRLGSPPFIA